MVVGALVLVTVLVQMGGQALLVKQVLSIKTFVRSLSQP